MRRRQPVIGRLRRLAESGWLDERPVGAGLLGLHPYPWGAELPRPGSDATVPKADARRLGVSSTQLQAAQQACQPLYPNAGGSFETQTNECMTTGNCPPALVQQILTLELSFAQCRRSHGLAHWPDPSLDPQGRPIFVISISRDLNGVDPHEPQISSKEDEGANLTGSPEPREVNP